MGCGVFGLLPTSILGQIGDSLPRASDRHIASVPNMYHSLGRGLQTLREVAGHKRVEEWEQAMQGWRDDEAARAVQQDARLKANYKKSKADWYSWGGTPRCGFRAIAKHYEIPIAWMRRLSKGKYQEGLDDSSSDDDDDLGDYDSDRTF